MHSLGIVIKMAAVGNWCLRVMMRVLVLYFMFACYDESISIIV